MKKLLVTAAGLLLVSVFLVSLFLGSLGPTTAQETSPAFAVLTGTAYRLVDQTVIDGVIVNQTQVYQR